jgi:hypothetical protein
MKLLLWQIFRGWTTFNEVTFAKTQKYEHGRRLNFKLTFCFMETIHEPWHLHNRSLVQWKYYGHTYKLYLNNYFLQLTVWIWLWWDFKLQRWMQNLHQSTWDHEILYADRSSEDEQIVIRPALRETKNTNMESGLNLNSRCILRRELMNHWT